jgi:hypothetical protein
MKILLFSCIAPSKDLAVNVKKRELEYFMCFNSLERYRNEYDQLFLFDNSINHVNELRLNLWKTSAHFIPFDGVSENRLFLSRKLYSEDNDVGFYNMLKKASSLFSHDEDILVINARHYFAKNTLIEKARLSLLEGVSALVKHDSGYLDNFIACKAGVLAEVNHFDNIKDFIGHISQNCNSIEYGDLGIIRTELDGGHIIKIIEF